MEISKLIKVLKAENITFNQFLSDLKTVKLAENYTAAQKLKDEKQFFTTFFSMLERNGGKFICPFNKAFMSITDKQAKYLDALRKKAGLGKQGGLFSPKYKSIMWTIYTPNNGSDKMYLSVGPMGTNDFIVKEDLPTTEETQYIIYRENGRLVGETAPASELKGAYSREETKVNGQIVKKSDIITQYKKGDHGKGRNLIIKRNSDGSIACAESECGKERYQPALLDYRNRRVSDVELIQYFELINWVVVEEDLPTAPNMEMTKEDEINIAYRAAKKAIVSGYKERMMVAQNTEAVSQLMKDRDDTIQDNMEKFAELKRGLNLKTA